MDTGLVKVDERVIGDESKQAVDARELHSFLQVGRKFNAWIRGRIEQYGFIENHDYVVVRSQTGPNLMRVEVGYMVSLDMAKELAMVERNEQGRRARRYFIEVENRYRKNVLSKMSEIHLPAAATKALELVPLATTAANCLFDDPNQAKLAAIKLVTRETGYNVGEAMGLVYLPAARQEPFFTPTELAQMTGLSSGQAINKLLIERGLQTRRPDSKGYLPTDLGKPHSILTDVAHGNGKGKSEQALRWYRSVLSTLGLTEKEIA